MVGGSAAAVGVVHGHKWKGVRDARWDTPGSPGTPAAGATDIVGMV